MSENKPVPNRANPIDPQQISRPDPALLKYYFLASLMAGPLFPVVFIPLFFKYETMRYKFEADGVSMSWGYLLRKEIHLTYRRIQDIHLTKNIVQRWLNLANVAIQTASGSATAEMTIEGILQAEELRDYLYSKMRGAEEDAVDSTVDADSPTPDSCREALGLLKEIRDALANHQKDLSHE